MRAPLRSSFPYNFGFMFQDLWKEFSTSESARQVIFNFFALNLLQFGMHDLLWHMVHQISMVNVHVYPFVYLDFIDCHDGF